MKQAKDFSNKLFGDLGIPIGNVPPIPAGCERRIESDKYIIFRLHYSADPTKTPEWAERRKRQAPSEAVFEQEFEIDPYAGGAALMFPEYRENQQIIDCKPFPIPHTWTRYMGIDPHKRRPHAMLWMAVSPDGDHWYYREYWPSRIYGQKGNTPEDDRLYKVDEYVDAIKFLEGPNIGHFAAGGFADNQKKQERIRYRIMDPHGKAIFTTTIAGKDEPETFWDRYAELGIRCIEAKKDLDSGRDTVGRRMRPRKVMYADGEKIEPVIHIFDTLPELRYELKTNRFPALTPAQAEVRDPSDKPLEKRKHMTDLLRYIEMSDPKYVDPTFAPVSVKPLVDGISY